MFYNGDGYPFTEPVSPSTKLFCITKKTNVKTLTRNFLKFQVMTPGKYRESVSKKGGETPGPGVGEEG